jgi:hypothetical protein
MRTSELDVGSRIYRKSVAGNGHYLEQGEFISHLVQTHAQVPSINGPTIQVDFKTHPLAVIVSQGCDLEQDFHARQGNIAHDKLIPTVLFCEMVTATELRSSPRKTSEIWNRIRNNTDERYHFFQKVELVYDSEGHGLDELGVDFKRFFTIPTDEVYHRIGSGEAKRRCCLESPYLEHFCRRFSNFIGRVALPQPHESE